MRLKEFFEYKNYCPLCKNKLSCSFYSKKRKLSSVDDNWYQTTIDMTAIKKSQKTYKAMLFLNKNNNSFFVDFCEKDMSLLDKSIPLSILNRFKSYNKNIQSCQIYKFCQNCDNYNYISNTFNIDFKKQTIGDLSIDFESFYLILPVEDGYKHFKLTNKFKENKSELFYSKFNTELIPRWDLTFRTPQIKTSLIKFSNEDMIDKLNKIILFS